MHGLRSVLSEFEIGNNFFLGQLKMSTVREASKCIRIYLV